MGRAGSARESQAPCLGALTLGIYNLIGGLIYLTFPLWLTRLFGERDGCGSQNELLACSHKTLPTDPHLLLQWSLLEQSRACWRQLKLEGNTTVVQILRDSTLNPRCLQSLRLPDSSPYGRPSQSLHFCRWHPSSPNK